MKPTFFIAEIGVNHCGSIDLAADLITLAKLAGANAVKFQTYKASTLAAVSSPSYWDLDSEPISSQRELFAKHECYDINFYEPLIELCKNLDIQFMTTCFDEELVDMFDPFLQQYKISSSDLTNFKLIDKICRKGKPVLLSCGASTLSEISATVDFISSYASVSLTLMHCVLNYPCHLSNANLSMISTLRSSFPTLPIGYSCHVPLPDALPCLTTAVALGATVIEKHFTASVLKKGNDHYHSITPDTLHLFRQQESDLVSSLGTSTPDLSCQSLSIKNARRSLYYSSDLPLGHVLTYSDLVPLRPQSHISADQFFVLLGSKLLKPVTAGQAAHPSDLTYL